MMRLTSERRAEVVRLGYEHGTGVGIGRERGFDVFDGHPERHARGGVDRRRQPTGLQVCQHHAQQEGPVEPRRVTTTLSPGCPIARQSA